MTKQLQAYTVGHSTRTIDEFMGILLARNVKLLVDVRRFPKSTRNPQFNTETLSSGLGKHGILYEWFEGLGGRRDGFGEKSLNKCWRSQSFRNYADHMETETFRQAAGRLIELIKENSVAVMCAEATYWRCHRLLISDYLKSEGVRVVHVLDATHSAEHEFSDCAKVRNGKLTYHDASNLDEYAVTI
jgi:uncharacterized protein (DUF488 family)